MHLTRQLGPLAAAALLVCAAPAGAYDPHAELEPVDLRVPVDQTVSDLDPLGASHRHVEPGNALHSNRVRVYERVDEQTHGRPGHDERTGLAMPGRYEYRAPGVRMRMDQPGYWSQTGPRHLQRDAQPAVDGAFAERIPAGAVFDLLPPDWTGAAGTDMLDWPEAETPAQRADRIHRAQRAFGPTYTQHDEQPATWQDRRIGPISTQQQPIQTDDASDRARMEHYDRLIADPMGLHR